MTGVSRSVLPPAEKGGNKINMASGQQWVLVEMVQAFYEVRRLFSVLQFPGGEKFWAHNRVSSASSTSSSAYQTPAVCEIIKPREATANFFQIRKWLVCLPGGSALPGGLRSHLSPGSLVAEVAVLRVQAQQQGSWLLLPECICLSLAATRIAVGDCFTPFGTAVRMSYCELSDAQFELG